MQANRKDIDHAGAGRKGAPVRRGLVIALIALVFGVSTLNLFSQTLDWALKYWICHPEYLSKTEIAGTIEVGILGIQLKETQDIDANITQVVLSPDGANTFDASADLADIHGYITARNEAFPAVPVPANRMTEDAFSVDGAGVITANFTGNNTITAGDTLKLHISFDIGSAAASSDLAYRITSVTYQSGTLTSPPAPSEIAHTTMKIRDFDTTLAATDTRGTDDAEQEQFIELLKITFGDAGDENARRRVDGIIFTSLGTDDADINSVDLYRDNGNGTFLASEEGTLDPGTWNAVAGTATFTGLNAYPSNTPYGDGDPSSSTAVFWFGARIATDATVTNDIQFEVTTPGGGADITFYDDVAEPVTGSLQTFTQVGYIGTVPTVQSNIHKVIAKQAVDNTPPTIIASSLDPGVNAFDVARNTDIQITFSDASGMDPASLNVTTPNFTLYNNTDSVSVDVSAWGSTVSGGNLVWTLSPDVDLGFTKNYTATVKGGAGGVQDGTTPPNVMTADYQWSFTTEARPTVNFTVPGTSASGVSINPTISATFTKAMDSATVEDLSNFTLNNGASVTAITYNPTTRTMTVTLGAALQYQTVYTATIISDEAGATGVTDINGNYLVSDYVWTFTTETQPQITLTSPGDGETGVSINPTITAIFTKPMLQATVEDITNFDLDNAANVTAITYNPGTQSMTVTLGDPLDFAVEYTATITTGMQDENGNALAADYVWSFTTEAHPTVNFTVPGTSASGISINPTISATFTKAMDSTTAEYLSNFTLNNGASVTAITYNPTTRTMTVTLGSSLQYQTVYTATIISDEAGATGVTDINGNYLVSDYVWTFTTETQPQITLTSPGDGETGVSINPTITAIFTKPMLQATVEDLANFDLDNAANVTAITYNPGNQSMTVTLGYPLDFALEYTATITTGMQDENGNALAADYVWSFITEARPTVNFTVPGTSASGVSINPTISVTFTKAMDSTTAEDLANFDLDNAANVTGIIYNPTTRTMTVTLGAALQYQTVYTATIISDEAGATGVTDINGNYLVSDYVWTFTTEAKPQVTLTSPGNGETGVSINPTITATFTKPMLQATVEDIANFDLDNAANVTAITYNPGTQSMTVTLGDPLDFAVEYTATITTGMQDENGNALAADYVWSFITEAQPQVTLTSPGDGETGVSINPTITATFTKPMLQATVENLANFDLDNAANVTAITYNPGTQSMTITLGDPLDFAVEYTATITTGMQDENGNALATDYQWTFTTEARPKVTVTTPAASASGVSITPTITATFSKPMLKATVEDHVNNFTFENEADVTNITYSPTTRTMTVTLGAALSYNTIYTATIISNEAGATGVTDSDGNYMASDYIWSFTTAQQYPDFVEPTAINNKIMPGATPSVKIFVPQPPNTKPADIVTIQIFTTTGQRVVTLTNFNETYQQVLARLPIVWDGTNGRKEKLGPGLYFIQIKSADYKKVLKVMIVR